MRLIIGVSGASGAIIGFEAIRILNGLENVEAHLVMTKSAIAILEDETTHTYEEICSLADYVYADDNLGALISSGSFVTDGMLIAPCSMKSLSAIANSYDANLLVRAADVCLKEGRKVVLMPREMPLNRSHLRNMLSCVESGCQILPPMLTFYNKPKTLEDQIAHIAGKALIQFGIAIPGFKAWGGQSTV
jgi:4-hydroxy-3-polyprenylbenzoate decarboxylase